MSDLITQLIRAERLLLETTLQSCSPFEGRDRARVLHADVLMETTKAIPKEPADGAAFPVEYQRLALSAETLQAIDQAFAGGSTFRDKPVTAEHICQAREFVQHHYGFDVSTVPVKLSQVPQTESVEGFFMSCGIAEGAVFLPSVFCSPVELIVHELGHAMHTTIRRQQRPTDYRFWIDWNSIGPEMCAYHAQFSYLIKHGTKEQFYVALGALLTSVSQLLCLLTLSAKLSKEEFQEYAPVQAYQNTVAWKALLDMYGGMHPTHPNSKQNIAVAVSGFTRGIGLALALKLIGEPQGLVAFMKEDTVAKPILLKLNEAFPHHKDLGYLDDINEVISQISARMLA
ncbi:hypothetical protein [Variovorax arabinosiphilus]|uniref:hypothetical protein n=1 Tax=Variovorax arabinosiphilus TaxID=3053498 RepID=UPI0025782A32|nr:MULTISPECIES: hypothetical protein [unclassified Variovorax]MDM0118686.1 hypothetical protein [Variovorax sp. J2L1-78]MDM0129111.1 hypothetical protein [Variovorax sp. J2L1-63]MDM0233102.1 hypothetical protein [Variovorax sp. J2R1-6]